MFDESKLKKALPDYLMILKGEKKPGFKLNNKLLDEKIKTAHKILKNCELCEHRYRIRGNERRGLLGISTRVRIGGDDRLYLVERILRTKGKKQIELRHKLADEIEGNENKIFENKRKTS